MQNLLTDYEDGDYVKSSFGLCYITYNRYGELAVGED